MAKSNRMAVNKGNARNIRSRAAGSSKRASRRASSSRTSARPVTDMTRRRFLKTAGVVAAGVGAAAVGSGGVARANPASSSTGEVTVNPDTPLATIQNHLANANVLVINFDPGEYYLEEYNPDGPILEITGSIKLRASNQNNKPILNIANTAYTYTPKDPISMDENIWARSILVNAPGKRVEFENLIIKSNRELNVKGSHYLRLYGVDIKAQGPANSAVYLGDYPDGFPFDCPDITGDVIVDNCKLEADTARQHNGGYLSDYRHNINAGVHSGGARANFHITNSYCTGNAGIELFSANNVYIKNNVISATGYIGHWVCFGILASHAEERPGYSANISNNKITVDPRNPPPYPEGPIWDPYYARFNPDLNYNGLGVQHAVAISLGHNMVNLPLYNAKVINNEVDGNSYLLWAWKCEGANIQNNRRGGLNYDYGYDYSNNSPFCVPWFWCIAEEPYWEPPIGFDFMEQGIASLILEFPGDIWSDQYQIGYVPTCEYMLMHSSGITLIDNDHPTARVFDHTGKNTLLGRLKKVYGIVGKPPDVPPALPVTPEIQALRKKVKWLG